ncbi:MAG: hypothetical protein ACFHX7_17205 [Pseudomonadota bacterium]
MQQEPCTPLTHIPWIRWLDRTQIPAFVIGICAWLVFVPFYNFNALAPRMPLEGAAFPPAFALSLMFLLQLTRGAAADLRQLIFAGKIDTGHLESLAASKRWARGELLLGLAIGAERVYAQLRFSADGDELLPEMSAGVLAVCFSIVAYTVVQVHLLAFCVRQVVVFRRVARSFQIDLMAPELNNALSNPLIRFIVVGLVGISFGLLIYEMIPYQSLQMRVVREWRPGHCGLAAVDPGLVCPAPDPEIPDSRRQGHGDQPGPPGTQGQPDRHRTQPIWRAPCQFQ